MFKPIYRPLYRPLFRPVFKPAAMRQFTSQLTRDACQHRYDLRIEQHKQCSLCGDLIPLKLF